MGIDQAMVAAGNDLDLALEKLRADVGRASRGSGRGRLGGRRRCRRPDLEARYAAHKAHVRRMTEVLRGELSQARVLADDALRAEREKDWQDLDDGRLPALLGALRRGPARRASSSWRTASPPSRCRDGFIFIRYVGTDLDAFRRAFDRMRVVEGTPVPEGQRGILLGKLYAEDWLKLRAARTPRSA